MSSLYDSWELVSLVADGAVILVFYYFYWRKSKEVKILSETPIYELDNNLIGDVYKSSTKSLPYVCLQGTVKCEGTPVHSEYTDKRGVIQEVSLYEHRARRIYSSWFDQMKEISINIQSVPFQLNNSKTNIDIKIKEPLKSEHLLFNLDTVFDLYTPAKSDGFSKVVDILSGDIVKGHSVIERMLLVGSSLTAFGMVQLDEKNCLILKPSIDGNEYILSTMNRSEIIEEAEHTANVYKTCTYLCLGIGAVILFIWMHRKYNERRESLERKKASSNITQRDSASIDDNNESSLCRVCLDELRNILLLPCRHIVTCKSCTDALPHPKLCPVCRRSIDSQQNVFLS